MRSARVGNLFGKETEYTSSSLFRDGTMGGVVMPGVDYSAVESRVSMAKVLDLLGISAQGAASDQRRGPCPIHASRSPHSRSFSVNVARGVCQCFKCGFVGNQIQLWAALKKMTVYEAAIDLCRQAGVEVPWIERWQTSDGTPKSRWQGTSRPAKKFCEQRRGSILGVRARTAVHWRG